MTTLHEAAQKAIYWLDQNGGAHIADELRGALSQQGDEYKRGFKDGYEKGVAGYMDAVKIE